MEITNRDDLRVGDIATFAYEGHEFTGPVWEREEGTLFIGSEGIHYKHWPTGELRWSEYFKFVRATRPTPALPDVPGSVIEITSIDGNQIEPTFAMLDDANDWVLAYQRSERWNVADYRITGWRPMKVVPA